MIGKSLSQESVVDSTGATHGSTLPIVQVASTVVKEEKDKTNLFDHVRKEADKIQSFIQIHKNVDTNTATPFIVGTICFLSIVRICYHDMIYFLGLSPLATILPPVSWFPLPFVWNVLTWHLFDSWKFVFTVPAIHWMMRKLERNAGSFEIFGRIILNLLVASGFGFALRLFQGDTVEPLYGTGCLCVSLSVFMSHTFPLQEVPYSKQRVAVRKLPSVVLGCLFLLRLLTYQCPEFSLAVLQLFVTWMYLRFYAASASGITGDRHFRFSGLFPEALRPALDIVSAAVWLAMVRSELIKYFRDIDLEMAEADEQDDLERGTPIHGPPLHFANPERTYQLTASVESSPSVRDPKPDDIDGLDMPQDDVDVREVDEIHKLINEEPDLEPNLNRNEAQKTEYEKRREKALQLLEGL